MKILTAFLSFIITFILLLIIFTSQRTFSPEEQEYIFLADIIKEQTEDIDRDQDKLAHLTDWLHENVKHGKYPPTFDGSSVYAVIKGGMGNCGFQACNISVMADIMGFSKHRVFHFQEELGAKYQHAFSEIFVDNKWRVYDPDLCQYESNNNEVMGLSEMLNAPQLVSNKTMREIIETQAKDLKSKQFKTTPSWQKTPRFEGISYATYEGFDSKFVFKSYLAIKENLTLFLLLLALGTAGGYFAIKKGIAQKRN